MRGADNNPAAGVRPPARQARPVKCAITGVGEGQCAGCTCDNSAPDDDPQWAGASGAQDHSRHRQLGTAAHLHSHCGRRGIVKGVRRPQGTQWEATVTSRREQTPRGARWPGAAGPQHRRARRCPAAGRLPALPRAARQVQRRYGRSVHGLAGGQSGRVIQVATSGRRRRQAARSALHAASRTTGGAVLQVQGAPPTHAPRQCQARRRNCFPCHRCERVHRQHQPSHRDGLLVGDVRRAELCRWAPHRGAGHAQRRGARQPLARDR